MLNESLARRIADAAGINCDARLHFLQCSSTSVTGAIILQAWVDGDDHPRAIVKSPRDPRRNASLAHEWETVQHLRMRGRLDDVLPVAVARFELGGVNYYQYAGLPGRTMFSHFRNRLLGSRGFVLHGLARQALQVAVAIHRPETRSASPSEIAQDLLDDLDWLEATVQELPATISARARQAASAIESARGLQLPFGRIHGDFSPFNLLTNSTMRSARARLIDWEHSEPERPQHLDLFRFMGTSVMMGRQRDARLASFEQVRDTPLLQQLLGRWLDLMSASPLSSMSQAVREALWWHYWIHAARREQERRGAQQDARFLGRLARVATSS